MELRTHAIHRERLYKVELDPDPGEPQGWGLEGQVAIKQLPRGATELTPQSGAEQADLSSPATPDSAGGLGRMM